MHGRFDRSDETSDKSIIRSFGIGIVVLPVLLVTFLVGLVINKPEISRWISEAAQAEFAGFGSGGGRYSRGSRTTSRASPHCQGLLTPDAAGQQILRQSLAIFR